MINRILLYYGFLVPLLIIYQFGSQIIRSIFLLFFVLMTVKLPYSDDFLDKSIKEFIPFLLTTILILVAAILMIDIVDLLYSISPNALFLFIIPAFLLFKILTFPWLFDKWGVLSIKKAFRQTNENNWLILSGLAFLLIANQITYLVFFLSAPVSYIIADNIQNL